MFFSCSEIENRMNQAGRDRAPFLFGVDFEMNEGFFIENPLVQSDVLFDIKGAGNSFSVGSSLFREVPPYSFEMRPEEFSVYEQRFKKVMNALENGESALTNLTIKTPIKTSLSLIEIFFYSKSQYKIFIPGKFVCFSPECFVKIENSKISTFPMKGTIDANAYNAEDIILNDPKEIEEHLFVVELLKNELSAVSDDVQVKRYRYIDILKTNRGRLLQVSSEIEGSLPSNYHNHLGSIIFKMLPAGSVSGTPKDSTVKVIREAEQFDRYYYTGIAGYYNGSKLDSFVLIRHIEQNNEGMFFRSGGGITSKSICRKEYKEALRKVYLPF